MPAAAILDEVEKLHLASTHIEALAEQHPSIFQELTSIAASVRNAATVLAVLVATRLHGDDSAASDGTKKPV